MIEIIPAVLVRTYEELGAALEEVRGLAPKVQIDVVDGVYAADTTWPMKDETHFPRITSGEEGMPLWESFDFEFDLMVQDPAECVERFVTAGASRLVLHAHSKTVAEALQRLQSKRTGEYPVEIGIAVPPDGELSGFSEFENQYDYIQVMGIDIIGAQGQELDHRVFSRIEELRRAHPDKPIQVDGGVHVENLYALLDAGANRLIVGSGIFGSDDPKSALRELLSMVESY